jgi:tRNA A-37 threonylcarbamoyl transferase component Bud32
VLADRYDLGDRLGTGGMADVYRATDRVLHREVAIKVLRETADTETDRARFTSEARTLARLSHVNLVMVLDAGMTTDQPFLVMELVEGTTLSERVQAGRLAPDEVAEIAAQLADALAYAHGQGIVHRDVKPGNVLLGHNGRVKLADFGIARLIGDTVRHTRTGTAIGTAAYLSPEQVRGDEVTPAADVYSLGLVLLEILSGERAFPGSPTESALARLNRDPDLPESLPEPWRRLLGAMTAREPAARPTAEAVARELRTLNGSGTTAVLDLDSLTSPRLPVTPTGGPSVVASLVDRARRVPPHVRAAAAAIGAILVLLVVAAIVSSGGDSGDPTEDAGTTIPAGVAAELQAPLRALHDAVDAVEDAPEGALDVVDSTLAAQQYPAARTALDNVISRTTSAEEAGTIETALAERIVTAAQALLAALPAEEATPPSDEPTDEDVAPPDTGKPDKDKDKGKGNGKGKGR